MTAATNGVVHAPSASGYLLPVINVTHPAFKMDDSPEAIERMRQQFALEEAQRKRMPKWLMGFFMFLVKRQSRLLGALLQPDSPVLDGLTTYVFKLAPEHLPHPFDNKFDRRFAASPSSRAMGLRVQQMARLLADGVRPALIARPDAPLYLINIGGGSAIDALNALIVLRADHPRLLQRRVIIHVLDPDSRGPEFGFNALAMLSEPGQPLAGLDAAWLHDAYDWNDTRILEGVVDSAVRGDMIVAASSEGALFEYGSDQAIVANLRALHARGSGACAVAGSVTRSDPLTRESLALSLYKLIPRGVEGFAQLIRDTGYSVAQVAPGLLADQVLLTPRNS